ncbi:hypothetical protein [Streptomyces sp. NPDC047453]
MLLELTPLTSTHVDALRELLFTEGWSRTWINGGNVRGEGLRR